MMKKLLKFSGYTLLAIAAAAAIGTAYLEYWLRTEGKTDYTR